MADFTHSNEPLRTEALLAHKRGWWLTPLNGKKPTLKGWPDLPEPTLDDIESWVAAGNLGVRTGKNSGVVVVDIDSQKGGDASHLELPTTVTARTGGGGSHHYFRCPSCRLKNSVGKLAKNVDIRSDGGQVVLPGSIHPDTQKRYAWEEGLSPDEVEVAEFPSQLLEILTHKKSAPSAARPRAAGHSGDALQHAVEAVESAPEGTRNETLNTQAFKMGRRVAAGLCDRGDVVEKLSAAADRSGLEKAEIDGVVERAVSDGMTIPTVDRPAIALRDGELPRIVEEAEAALLADQNNERIFQRGGELVRVTRIPKTVVCSRLSRRYGSLQIRPLRAAYLVERLMRAAEFGRWTLIKGEPVWVPADCPDIVARTCLEWVGLWNAPGLVAILESPTILLDGTAVEAPGYDAASGLYFEPGGTTFAPIPDQPTRDDACEGLAALRNVLADFPWVAPSDEATAIAAILTALVRRSLPTAPLFAFRAPTMGSGKSLLADVVAMHATGRPAPALSQGKDEDEIRKRIFALLREGDPVVCIDNIERPLSGDSVCSVLTQQTYKDRILGESKTAEVPTTTTFLATGNNLVIEGDLTSRVLPCDLDPKCERPEQRPFDVNLYEYVPRNRGELVIGALTIMKAYIVAGKPDQGLTVFGRFEAWSEMVRAPLVWCGMQDPCEGRIRLEEIDPVTTLLRAVLAGWHALVGEETLTANALILRAKPDEEQKPPPLWDALLEVARGPGGEPDPRRLGKWIGKYQRRVQSGLRFERAVQHQGTHRWRVGRA